MPTDDGVAPGGFLAIHLGEQVGWCYGTAHGLWRLPKSDDHGYLGAALIDAVAGACKLLQPTAIILSGPPSEVEAGTRPDIAVLHIGLLMAVKIFAYRRHMKVDVPNVETMRHEMLGRSEFHSRSGLRDAALSFCKRRGIDAIDQDAAHAIVLWSYRSQ